jgi:hypothetical protein
MPKKTNQKNKQKGGFWPFDNNETKDASGNPVAAAASEKKTSIWDSWFGGKDASGNSAAPTAAVAGPTTSDVVAAPVAGPTNNVVAGAPTNVAGAPTNVAGAPVVGGRKRNKSKKSKKSKKNRSKKH